MDVIHGADGILTAKCRFPAVIAGEFRVSTFSCTEGEIKQFWLRRGFLHRMRIMRIARPDMLIENIPVPQPSIAAKIQLPGTNSADGHADIFEILPFIDSRNAALVKRLQPIGVQFFVGGKTSFSKSVYRTIGQRQ